MAKMVNGMAMANWCVAPVNAPVKAPPDNAVQMVAVMRDPLMVRLALLRWRTSESLQCLK